MWGAWEEDRYQRESGYVAAFSETRQVKIKIIMAGAFETSTLVNFELMIVF